MRVRGVAAVGGAAVVAGAGAGFVVKRSLDRILLRADPFVDDDFDFPDDCRHQIVPTYDGGELHVVERGPLDAQPLLLLHGVTLQAGIWQYQLQDLADRFRVIAVDLRGHGDSRAGRDGYGLTRVARDISTVLGRLDLRATIIVGHSMGGMALMRFCADDPAALDERVAGLVFLATTTGFAAPILGNTVLRYVSRAAVRWGDKRGWRHVPAYRFPPNMLTFAMIRRTFGVRPSPTHIELVRRMLVDVPADCFLPAGFSLLDHDPRRELAETDTPSLVIVGTHDHVTPVRHARRLAHLLPRARLEVMVDCGHQVMLERRAELAELVTAFAREVATVELGPNGRR